MTLRVITKNENSQWAAPRTFNNLRLFSKETLPVRAKNIGALLVFWIGTMGIAFLAGYVPKHSQLRDDEVQIANLDFKLKLAHLRTLAGTLYLQSSERNYGLAAQTSSQFFDQLPSFVDQVNDPKLNQMLMELSKSQDQITAGLANGDPAVLPKIADLLQKTLSTETL